MLLALLGCLPDGAATKAAGGGADDDGAACVYGVWYTDADGDGFGDQDTERTACDAPVGTVADATDCDDGAADVYPGADEACNHRDDNCDGVDDEGLETVTRYGDADHDGWGDDGALITACDAAGAADGGDCDDTRSDVNPDAREVCDGFDNDCDGLTDDDDSPVAGVLTWYADADGDGFGDPDATTAACAAPPGAVVDNTDCDDGDAAVNPGAEEVCLDATDQDCDGYADDYAGDCARTSGSETGSGALCDESAIAADATLCGTGVAAILGTSAVYASIQGAIDNAASGDIVTICAGSWSEPLTIDTIDLTLLGAGSAASVMTGVGRTLLTIEGGGTVTIRDLGFEGGRAYDGGGILLSSSNLCIADSAFALNEAEYGGGAINAEGSGSLSIDGTTFYANYANYNGGAIYAYTYSITIADSWFYANTTDYEGGALAVDLTATTTIDNTVFERNEAASNGGAIGFNGRTSAGGLVLTGCTFVDNTAGYAGGAISTEGWDLVDVTAVNSAFTGNTADYEGGAVDQSSWGGVTFTGVASTFSANDAGYSGGAFNMGGWSNDAIVLEGCTLDANTSRSGAGIEMNGRSIATVTIIESTVTSNAATGTGGGIDVSSDGTVSVTNTDFGTGGTDNSPDDAGGSSAWGAAATFSCAGGICR